MARLENWTIFNSSLVGDIFDDPRFENGFRVVTSPIRTIDFEERTAQTRNTIYTLGEPLNGTVQASQEVTNG